MELEKMKYFTVNGISYAIKIHQQVPSLPYLIMLHGFMGDSRVFKNIASRLKTSCNPVAIDLLGHGKTDKVTDSNRYREDQQTGDIASLVHAMGISQTLLYGYSMGGRLALKAIERYPNLFDGLILESTSFGIKDEQSRKERRETDRERARYILENFNTFLEYWETLPLFHSPFGDNQTGDSTYEKIQAAQHPGALAASLKGFGAGSMTPLSNTANFEGPVLLLAGSEDQKYIDNNKILKQLFRNVTVHTIPAGHRVHWDNPEHLCEAIKLFIEQIA